MSSGLEPLMNANIQPKKFELPVNGVVGLISVDQRFCF